MRLIPLRPLTRPSQNSGTLLPIGVRAPMPVTTTRRYPSRIGLSTAHLLVARDDDAQRRLDGNLPIDAGGPTDPAEHAAQLLDLHLQQQRVAGHDHAPEAAVVDAGEQAELAAV